MFFNVTNDISVFVVVYFVADSHSWRILFNAYIRVYFGEFFSGFFTATIFIPGIIILTNLFPGVFTAAGITEPPIKWSKRKFYS